MVTNDPIDRAIERTPDGDERRARLFAAALVGLAVLPLVVALWSLYGTHWYPVSDVGAEMLRIRDVGTRHTPLTGAQSRYGWDHPGPLLFWWLAPWSRAFGDTGVLYGVGLLNGAAIVAALAIARRRGGMILAVVVAVAVVAFVRTVTPTFLLDPWNPSAPVFLFLVYVLLAWSLAERRYGALIGLAAVGSFAVQAHVGYVPLVAGLAVVAVLLAWFTHASRPVWIEVRRPLWLAAAVGGAAWAAPLWQQLTSDTGYLRALFDSFRHSGEEPLGWSVGLGVMGRQLGPPGAWLTGDVNGPFGAVGTGSTIGAWCLLGVVAMLGFFAWRQGDGGPARLAAIALTTVVFGVFTTARITGFAGPYLVRWWAVIAITVWCSIVWSVSSLLRFDTARRVAMAFGVGALVVLSVLASVDAVPARGPEAQFSLAVRALRPQIESTLSAERNYLVVWADRRNWGSVGVGVFVALEGDGYDVDVSTLFAHTFGSWRVASPDAVDGIVQVVASDDLDNDLQPQPGAEIIATYDPLIPDERERLRRETRELRAQLSPGFDWTPEMPDSHWGRAGLLAHGADPSLVESVRALRADGSGYVVYLSPPPS